MSEYAAFLRGINVGRHRRVGSADLRSAFEAIGFEDVATFRTSGNVVFSAGREARTKLVGRIEAQLAKALGMQVTVFVRTAAEILAVAEHNPFDRKVVEASTGKLQVVLLADQPSARARKEVLALATDEDPLAFHGRELYWLPSRGVGGTELDIRSVERSLGPTTVRTKGTIEALAAKFFR